MRRLKIFLIVFVILCIGAFVAWKFINKGRDDHSNQKPELTSTADSLIYRCDNDTSLLAPYKNKVVAVQGKIKSLSKQNDAIAFELGDSTNLTSIVCQIDDRYLNDFKDVEVYKKVCIKGIMTYDIDDLGMGNTIHLDNCTLHK